MASSFICCSGDAHRLADVRRYDTAGVFAREDSMPLAKPEWSTAITHIIGAGPDIASFRASGGLAVVLLGDPRRVWYFGLAEQGRLMAGSWRFRPRSTSEMLTVGAPSDVMGVASDGTVHLLDSVKGRITSDNIGGYSHLLTDYRLPATVRRGCALRESRYAYHDAARTNVVSIRSNSTTESQEVLVVQTALDGVGTSGWSEVQLSGAIGRPCILWSPIRTNAFVVSDSTATPVNLHDFSEDMASCPRGLAVIPKGKTHGRRVVRFFDATGQPTGVMRFNRSILNIGCTDHRLIVLAATTDSTYLASYVLPVRLRDSTFAHEATVIAPPSPISRRAN